MTLGGRRRIAVGAALALGVALVLARRSQTRPPVWHSVEPPPRPRPVVVPPPPPAPPPAAAVVAPPLPLGGQRTRIAVATGVIVLAGALLAASLWPKSNSLANSFQGTIPSLTAATTTSATTGTTATTDTTPVSAAATLCVKPPKGWESEWVPPVEPTAGALVVTNFAFGAGSYEWGLLAPHLRWAPGDVMIAVADWTSTASPAFRRGFAPGDLSIRSSDIGHYSAFKAPIGHRLIRMDGRLLEIFVEARPPTAAAFAAANRVLAGVSICSP